MTVACASPSTSGRCTAIAPGSATPSGRCAMRSRARRDVELLPYVISARARLRNGERRLPIPAALAHRHVGSLAPTHASTVSLRRRRPGPRHELRRATEPAAAGRVGLRLLVPRPSAPRRPGRRPRRRRAAPSRVAAGAYVHASSQASASRRPATARHRPGRRRSTSPRCRSAPPARPSRRSPGCRPDRFVVAIGTQERRKNLPRLVRGVRSPPSADGVDAGSSIAGARETTPSAMIDGDRDASHWPHARGSSTSAGSGSRRSGGCCTMPPRSPIRRSTRGSASRSSRRSRSVWPSSAATPARSPRSAATGVELVDPVDPASIAAALACCSTTRRTGRG